MDETLTQLEHLRRTGQRVAMATLVATRGTTPRKEGARMWIGEDGRILGSVTIGGCVDARVIQESEEVLASGRSKRLAMELGDEEAWDLGLTCSGTIEVYVEPLELEDPANPVALAYERIRAEVQAGRHAVSVTPLDGTAVRMVVLQDGTRLGTLGDEALDSEATARALELVQQRASCTLGLDHGAAPLDAFFEVHGPPATLVVVGANAVAMPLVYLAEGLGLRTIVVDGRPRFATPERFPGADELRVGIPSEIVEGLTLSPSTFVVLVAHDYKYDLPVLRHVLRQEVAYVGLLGSRRRGKAILDFLAAEGIPPQQLSRIHVPVGLDIGAQTAPEIALAILAEAVAVRAGRAGGPLRERKPR